MNYLKYYYSKEDFKEENHPTEIQMSELSSCVSTSAPSFL